MKRGRRKAAPGPAVDLEDFLRPFTTGLRRSENRQAFERYISGLLSSLARKTASDMGRALDDTSSQRLQEFLTRTPWNPAAINRARIQEMLANGTSGSGRLVLGEIAFEKDGTGSVGVDRQFAPSLRRRAARPGRRHPGQRREGPRATIRPGPLEARDRAPLPGVAA